MSNSKTLILDYKPVLALPEPKKEDSCDFPFNLPFPGTPSKDGDGKGQSQGFQGSSGGEGDSESGSPSSKSGSANGDTVVSAASENSDSSSENGNVGVSSTGGSLSKEEIQKILSGEEEQKSISAYQKALEKIGGLEAGKKAIQNYLSDDEYFSLYQELNPLMSKLQAEMIRVLFPNKNTGVELKKSGSSINLKAGMRFIIDRKVGNDPNSKIFEKRKKPEKHSYAFSILLDVSGSMSHNLQDAKKGAILLMEVLNRLNQDVSVQVYDENIHTIKSIDEKVNDQIRKNLTGQWILGGTNIPNALKKGSKELEKSSAKTKVLILISDGIDSIQACQNAVSKIKKETNHHIVGLGIGQGTEFLNNFLENTKVNLDSRDLPKIMSEVVREFLPKV